MQREEGKTENPLLRRGAGDFQCMKRE